MNEDMKLMEKWQKSPIQFINDIWSLTPADNKDFVKGKHITRQQEQILLAVEKALKDEAPRRMSIASGHGIGKSTTLAWLIIWYLMCHKDAKVPCTAPSSEQMHDVLWAELAKWLNLMPRDIKNLFDWTSGYLRIKESPENWFARARTARKENPEALAGIHGDWVMMVVDEASGVPEEIFNTAEGALTDKNILVILISNPTRLTGYFHDTHHNDNQNWQLLQFSSEDSPIVDDEFVDRIVAKHGKDSDEYRIRVQGLFPRADAVDDKGYVPLLLERDIREINDCVFELNAGERMIGVDPAGEGTDESVWVIRDSFKAKVLYTQKTSTPKTIAQSTLTLMVSNSIDGNQVFVDNFGVGANVAQEIAFAGERIEGVNVGVKAEDDRFINLRAEAYWRLREWLVKGGEIIIDPELKKQLLSIRFRRNLAGRIQIMSKDDMRKQGVKSPDRADALMLTFLYEGDSGSSVKIIRSNFVNRI